jgi:hypothetical protein
MQLAAFFIFSIIIMKWYILHLRWDEFSLDADVLLFPEENQAILYSKELLLCEYGERDLFAEYFNKKSEKLVYYSDPVGTNWFLIKVLQKWN